jgi:hypothetical protein
MAPPFIVVDGSAVQRLDSFELATVADNLKLWSWIAERIDCNLADTEFLPSLQKWEKSPSP